MPIRKICSIGILIFAVFIGSSSAASAEISGDIALLSDYRFRGISQTSRNPAVQGGIEVSLERGWSFGLWGSNVDFSADPTSTSSTVTYATSVTTPAAAGYQIDFARDATTSMIVLEDCNNDASMTAGCNPSYTLPADTRIPAAGVITFVHDAQGDLVFSGADPTDANPIYVITTTQTVSGASTSAEIDAYITYSSEVGERFAWSATYVRYFYPGYSALNYPELLVDFSIGDFSLGLVYSNDYFATGGAGNVISAGYSRAFGDGFSLALGYAATSADVALFGAEDSYSSYSIAVGLDTEAVSYGLSWEDTSLSKADCGGNDCESTLVFSIGKSF